MRSFIFRFFGILSLVTCLEFTGFSESKILSSSRNWTNDYSSASSNIKNIYSKLNCNGNTFHIFEISPYYIYIIDEKGNFLVNDTYLIRGVDCEDFNQDGFNDILISITETPFTLQVIYQYNPFIKQYLQIENSSYYENLKYLGVKSYYYSHFPQNQRANEWYSSLIIIKDYVVSKPEFELVGIIDYKDKNKNGIYFCKIGMNKIEMNTRVSGVVFMDYESSKSYVQKFWEEYVN